MSTPHLLLRAVVYVLQLDVWKLRIILNNSDIQLHGCNFSKHFYFTKNEKKEKKKKKKKKKKEEKRKKNKN